jgi:hypothetical protein
MALLEAERRGRIGSACAGEDEVRQDVLDALEWESAWVLVNATNIAVFSLAAMRAFQLKASWQSRIQVVRSRRIAIPTRSSGNPKLTHRSLFSRRADRKTLVDSKR